MSSVRRPTDAEAAEPEPKRQRVNTKPEYTSTPWWWKTADMSEWHLYQLEALRKLAQAGYHGDDERNMIPDGPARDQADELSNSIVDAIMDELWAIRNLAKQDTQPSRVKLEERLTGPTCVLPFTAALLSMGEMRDELSNENRDFLILHRDSKALLKVYGMYGKRWDEEDWGDEGGRPFHEWAEPKQCYVVNKRHVLAAARKKAQGLEGVDKEDYYPEW